MKPKLINYLHVVWTYNHVRFFFAPELKMNVMQVICANKALLA